MKKPLIDRAATAYLLFWARVLLRLRRPLIVGITGSVGKTTTKEVIAAALKHPQVRAVVGEVRKTPGNMNNTLGVPLVVLGYRDWPGSRRRLLRWALLAPLRAFAYSTVRSYPKVLVLEFAAGPEGDIARTASAAPPNIAVVTAIGPAHLEAFGTIDRIVSEKSALVRRLPRNGLAVLGAENSHAATLDRVTSARIVKVPGRGRTLSENAARAVCEFLGVPAPLAERALTNAPKVKGRLNIVDAGPITVIDDAYNANPLSMQLGLDTLASRSERRVAVLGDMKELGTDAPRYHEEIGEYARPRADLIVGVGEMSKLYRPDLWFATSQECAAALNAMIAPGDCVLVKGSHSVGLDTVVQALKQLNHHEAA